MDTTDAAHDRHQDDGRGAFERFVEAVYARVSGPGFFAVVLMVLALWAASFPFWSSTTKWELALHTGSAVLSLILLVLLENSARRSDEAAQEKLNVLAEALSDLMESRAQDDPDLRESVRRLRQASGLEERH